MSYIGNTPFTAAFLTDTFSGNGSTVAFTMSVAPANTSSILVAVTGVVQDPSTYSVSGTTLTFSQAPPSGTSNISVRYLGIPASGVTTTAYRTQTEFTATAGQTTFTVPSYTVGFIDVYRNGLLLGSADFTATTGTTVVLANAASAGDFIETVSFYVSSVLNAIPATNNSVQQTYLASGVAGTGPAFSAYQSSTQTVSNATWTKVQLQTKEFDTASAFDSTTNYRFQPSIAGYYQVQGLVTFAGSASNIYTTASIYKNGASFKVNQVYGAYASGPMIVALVYLNGSTDYLELYGYQASGGNLGTTTGAANTYFQSFLARAA